MKGLETLIESNSALRKAHRLHHKFTADEQLMAQYEARQKHLRDVASIKSYSYDEGFKKGEQIGDDNRTRTIVHTMHQKDLDIPTIAEYTSLSTEKVAQILNETTPE